MNLSKNWQNLLRCNYFKFDYNLQVNGCSMGGTVAASYANLCVGVFEEKFIYNPTENQFVDLLTSLPVLGGYR